MADKNEIKKVLYGIISEVLNFDVEDLSEDMDLELDLRMDSLSLYEIVVEVEEVFDIRISNDEADDLVTIKDTIDYIAQNMK